MNETTFRIPEDDEREALEELKRVRKAQQRRAYYYLAASVGIIVFFLLFFLFSPFFHINDVVIVGNYRVSQEEIRTNLQIHGNTHMLLFNTRSARSRVMENLYIADVQIERLLPGRMHVEISERRLTAYVELENMPGHFLFLDDYGRVLEVRTYFFEPLPVLDGLRFTRFQVGEILEVPDTAAFNVIVQYAQLLNTYELIDRVTRINASDSSNIRITIENIEFNVGGVANADEKIRTIVEILNEMPNVGLIPGSMDISVIRGEYFFEMLH
ncbi:MAG: FtsQ-type POTRA domain-containing protein [Defluviitaleaceae bacterium]|nr:FtsQ-type POTRA domain-containing protein [Defluviitaleaceae bacterium]